MQTIQSGFSRGIALDRDLSHSFQSPSISDPDGLYDRQKSTARIAGALAHELNSPLQGLSSLLTVFRRECAHDEECLLRVEQMRSGLVRLSRIVESFSVAYEHMPRTPDRVSVGLFEAQFLATLAAHQLSVKTTINAPRESEFFCMLPELIRLLGDVFSLPSPEGRRLFVRIAEEGDVMVLFCILEGTLASEASAWRTLDGQDSSSSLAVLIDEISRFARGRAEFLFDHSSLSGIRLIFAVA
jgi:hypothetical protein